MSKLITGKEHCDRCNKPYIAALGGVGCRCKTMKVYSDVHGWPCYKSIDNKNCDLKTCADPDCQFKEWLENNKESK
jgi:hypothetical protein